MAKLGGEYTIGRKVLRIAALAFAAICQAFAFSPTQAVAGTETSGQCWPESALAFRPGEQIIRKHIAAARVPPPREDKGSLASPAAIPSGAVRRVKLPPGSKKLIALTFDLCEQPHEISGYQGGIVDFLRAQKVKATFFAGGKWLMTHPERAGQLMSDPLFEIGNHGWEHRNLRIVSGSMLAQEIEAPQRAYRILRAGLAERQCVRPGDTVPAHQRAPESIRLFRFPYGACDAKSLNAVASAGLTAIQWDVSAGDPWPRRTASPMIKGVLAQAQPGSIVIFHANGRGWHTEKALPQIVATLKARGYEFVTVSELLRAGEPVVESRCYDVRPGDTDRYDLAGRRFDTRSAKRAALRRAQAAPPDGGWPFDDANR
ncbi:MAG: polysaccharide deacetylase family protein [Rhodomicrobium sp.]|nr:polysaccharide deacetylase family protein [Rhodomicrobium sp.]